MIMMTIYKFTLNSYDLTFSNTWFLAIKHATLQDGPDPMLELQAGLTNLQLWLMRLRTFISQCS